MLQAKESQDLCSREADAKQAQLQQKADAFKAIAQAVSKVRHSTASGHAGFISHVMVSVYVVMMSCCRSMRPARSGTGDQQSSGALSAWETG